MSKGGKIALVIGISAILLILIMSQRQARASTQNKSTSNVFDLFAFGKAAIDLTGKIIGPGGESTTIDGPEDEYTGEGGYDTSKFRVYND
jgi:hypothetical protein